MKKGVKIFLFINVLSILLAQGQIVTDSNVVLGFEDIEPIEKTANLDDDKVPFWSTTSADKYIEVWVDKTSGINASEGTYFVELNATENASLYFDIDTKDYQIIKLTFDHRARENNGLDEIEILAGIPHKILKRYGSFESDNNKWYTYTVEIPILKNQTKTRISFEAIATTSGDDSVGNFIDNVNITLDKKEETMEPISIKLFPSPVINYLEIEIINSNNNFDFKLFNFQGELINQKQVNIKSKIDLNHLKPGRYLMILSDDAGINISKKHIIKQ